MSLPVSIELNTDLQPFFTLPGKLHLSLENPGPVQVDPTSLNELERLWINQGAQSGVLRVDNPNKKEKKVADPVKEEKPQVEVKAQESVQFPQREEKVKGIKKILSGKVGNIKKAIKSSDDILFLRLVREVERDNKSRKSILEAVDMKIGEIQSKLASEIGASEGDNQNYFVTDPLLRNLPVIEEEAGETVIIKPLTDED